MIDEDLQRHVRAIELQVAEEHPDLETELFPYAEGTLVGERAAEITEHLATCARCREDVDDARAMAAQRPHASRIWIPLAAVLAALAITMLLLMRERAPQSVPVTPPAIATTPPITTQDPTPPAHPEWDAMVRDARAGRPLGLSYALQSLRARGFELRGTNGVAAKLAPSGVILESARPAFTWPAMNDATAIVTVFSEETEVAQSSPLTTNRWTPDRDLPRGAIVTWQVELTRGDELTILPAPPAPPARFVIVPAETVATLDEARRERPNDPLLLGLLYANAGLIAEARDAFERVDAPADVPVAQRLLRELPR